MHTSRPFALALTAVGGALFLVGAALGPGPEAPAEAARPPKSVYGTLETVNRTKNTLIMRSDGGESLAWQFGRDVIAEAAAFKPGDPMIVIYRLLPSKVKRVTALAFPDVEKVPTYVNMTGERVTLRSAAAVEGACEDAGSGAVTESVIPAGGRAEVLEDCWCCAVAGESCRPTTRSGMGRAFLVQCFE